MKIQSKPDTKVVWEPLRFADGSPTSQCFALTSPARVTCYHGTRGPGKTEAQLMSFRKEVGVGYGPYWRGIILDHEYKNLDDIVAKSRRLFSLFEDGAKFSMSKGEYVWRWPTGEELLFRAASDEKDYDAFHGHEYPFIGWNELTKYANDKLYRRMFSVNRSSFLSPPGSGIPPIPLRVFITTNSYGPGRNWVKRELIDPGAQGEIVSKTVELIKPGTFDEKITATLTQTHIFGSWKENRFLSAEYIAELMQEPNEALRESWVNGSWDIVAGGAFDDVWRPSVHLLPRFPIPATWKVDRCFDWGSTKPFYVGWVAECDGSEVEFIDNGKLYTFGPPKGTLIVFAEWYGCDIRRPNTGLKIASSDIAKGIVEYEQLLRDAHWIDARCQVAAGPADNQIRNDTDTENESVARVMSRHGVDWTPSDKSAGAPRLGLEIMREMLLAARRRPAEAPGLYFMRNCKAAVSTIPSLPRDEKNPDVVDKNAEDHPFDAIRYRCLAARSKIDGPVKVSAYY